MYGVFGNPKASVTLDQAESFRDEHFTLWRSGRGVPCETMDNKDRCVSLYGSIYNLAELPEPSRSEHGPCAILDQLSASGTLDGCLSRLNGSFFLVVYDKGQRRLRLISDRYGSKKCYYGIRAGVLYFFPQLYHFARLGFRARIDQRFAASLICFHYLADDRTTLDGVNLIPAGSVLEVANGTASVAPYWTWRFEHEYRSSDDFEQATRILGERWMKAVDQRIASRSSLLLPLSGGYDSRAILAAAMKCSNCRDITTLTIGTPGTLDYEIGNLVAKSAGTKHIKINLTTPRAFRDEFLAQSRHSDGMAIAVSQWFPTDWARLEEVGSDIISGFLGETLMGAHLLRDLLANDPDPAINARAVTERLVGIHLRADLHLAASLLRVSTADLRDLLCDIVRTGRSGEQDDCLASCCE